MSRRACMQRSTQELADSHKAAEEHRAALERMRTQLRDVQEQHAADAAGDAQVSCRVNATCCMASHSLGMVQQHSPLETFAAVLLMQAEKLQAIEADTAELQAQAARPQSEPCPAAAMLSAVAGVMPEGQQPSTPGPEPSAELQHAAASMVTMEEQRKHGEPPAAANIEKAAPVSPDSKPASKHVRHAAAWQATKGLTEDTPDELEVESSPPQTMQMFPQAEQPGAGTAGAHAEKAQGEPEQHAGAESQANSSAAHIASEGMQLPAKDAQAATAANLDSAMHPAADVQGGSGIQYSAAASQPEDLFASFAAFQDLLQPEAGGADSKKRKRDGPVV